MGEYGKEGKAECVKCGFSNLDALAIDHINEDGAAHRRQLWNTSRGRGGGGIYHWLRARGFPSGFQTLCFNCNTIKHMEKKRQDRLNKLK